MELANVAGPAPGPGGDRRGRHARGVGMTLASLLEAPLLTGHHVIAGAPGLHRQVRSVNVMEIRDIVPWMRPKSVLITTGYPLRNVPEELEQLIADLDDCGVSGLLIKANKYIKELPGRVVAEADRRGFPVVRLPDPLYFDDLIVEVMQRALDHQAALLQRSDEIHGTLIDLVLRDGGPQDLVDAVRTLLHADGVLLLDADGSAVFSSGDIVPDAEGVLASLPENDHHLPSPALAVGIRSGSVRHGKICAFSTAADLDTSDIVVLERAATVLALILHKQRAVDAVEGRYRGEFLRDLLFGQVVGGSDHVASHCQQLGWDVARPLAVVSAELDEDVHPAGASGSLRSTYDLLAARWEGAVKQLDRANPVAAYGRELVGVVGAPDAAEASQLGRRLLDGLARGIAGRTVSAGISRVVDGPRGLPEAYRQARKALEVGRSLRGRGTVCEFDSLGALRLLATQSSGELDAYVEENLCGFADGASSDAAQMRRTLKVLLDVNFNVAQAARILHLHYNTLRIRLSNLEAELGPFREDPERRFNIMLALRLTAMRSPECEL